MDINELLVEKLKLKLDFKKDQELASIFNVTPFVFSTWKKSRYKLLYETIRYGLENNLDFNSIFYDFKETIEEKHNSVRVLHAEDLFSYYINSEEPDTNQKRHIISFLEDSTIGFQVISQNMEPKIAISSYVFGKPIKLEELENNKIYILNVKDKGIYISRFTNRQDGYCNFDNDNPKFSSYSFMENDIMEVFNVEGNFKNFA